MYRVLTLAIMMATSRIISTVEHHIHNDFESFARFCWVLPATFGAPPMQLRSQLRLDEDSLLKHTGPEARAG